MIPETILVERVDTFVAETPGIRLGCGGNGQKHSFAGSNMFSPPRNVPTHNVPFPIFKDRPDPAIAQTSRIRIVVHEMGERLRFPIESIQTFVRSDPDGPAMVSVH